MTTLRRLQKSKRSPAGSEEDRQGHRVFEPIPPPQNR